MKPNFPYFVVIGFFILSILSGCGRSAPAPVVNPPGVETSLASTARAFAKQTEAADPFTQTPSPTATETATPTPKISLNGTSLVMMEDQVLFTDHKVGYQLTFPSSWLPIRLNEDEYYKAFTHEVVAANPKMVDFLTKIQNQNTDYVRLLALDIRPDQPAGGLISGITVVLQPEKDVTMEEWANTRSKNANIPGYQLISKQFKETTSGIRILVREESFDSLSEEKTYQRRVYFSTPSGIITMDLETPLDSKDARLSDFEEIVNSLVLNNP